MALPPSSLVDRAGPRPAASLAKIISRGLEGADDGELFLEYRQAEMLVFDNGRLKQATYDTSQGFGLRAVKDEAVGYAHASDVSEAAIARAADAVRAVKRRLFRPLRRPAAAHQRQALRRGQPARAARLSKPRRGSWKPSTPMRAPRIRACARSRSASARTWQAVEVVRADGETYRDVRPLVRVNVSVVVGDGDRQETGSAGYGGREGYAALHRSRDTWQHAVDERRAPGAGQSRRRAGAGRRDGRRARPGLARRHAARSGRPRARRRFQPQEDLGLRRAASVSASPPTASPSSMTAPSRTAAARCRSTTKARRPTAPC